MANMAPAPWEIAFNQVTERDARRTWVIKNKNRIRNIYKRVAGFALGDNKLARMAADNSDAWQELTKMIDYDGYREIYESYHGKNSADIRGGKFKDKGTRERSKLNATMRFYGNLTRKYETPEGFARNIQARTSVDQLRGTDSRLVKLYGYDRLVKAFSGDKSEQKLIGRVKYFQGLDPIMRKYFGRGATPGDVLARMDNYKSPGDYEDLLVSGTKARGLSRQISEGALQGFGSQGEIKQSLFSGESTVEDFQRRISEARVIREQQYKGASSRVTGGETEAGFLKQNLF